MADNCQEHEKVYSGEFRPTTIRRWAWICARCSAWGWDAQEPAPVLDPDRFIELMKSRGEDIGWLERALAQKRVKGVSGQG